MTPTQRIARIDQLIADFEASVSAAEASLMDRLAESAKSLLDNPANIAFVMRDWHPQWVSLIQDLTTGILSVSDLNEAYFAALSVSPDVLSLSKSDLLTAIGITAAGLVIEGGYLSTLINDTSIGRQIVSLVTDAQLRKLTEPCVIARLKPLIKGKQSKGVLGKLFDSLPTQPHVEADRVMQQVVGTRANLKARLYLGGLIDSSRPFCVVRNGKTFLVEEVERFGTPKDTYGGYVDKSAGYFSGKPRAGYEPFTMCGGIKCRHHLNVISNAEALRRRDDLEEKNGVLKLKKA